MSSKLHILFISSWFPSKDKPTLGNFVENHAKSVSLLHKVSVIYVAKTQNLDSVYKLERRDTQNYQVLIMYFRVSTLGFKILDELVDTFRYWKSYLTLYKSIGSKPDLIHANVVWPIGLLALYFNFFYKIKFVLTEHWTIYLPQNRSQIKPYLFKLINKYASRILPVSMQLKKMMQESGIEGEFSVVPNTVDTTIFKYKEKINSNFFRFIHISTLVDEHKNVKGILRAFREMMELDNKNILLIISDGEIEPIKDYAKELGFKDEDLKFIGTQEPEQIANYLQSSDVYLQFSNYETFGIVPAEALCCGSPVISTQVGFLQDYEEEQIGHFVKIGDEKALLEKMLKIKQLNFNAKKASEFFSQQFSEGNVAQQFSNIYSEVLQ